MAGQGDVNTEFESSASSDISEDRDMNDEISFLIERVDQLEDTTNKITEQQGEITHRLNEYAEKMDSMSDAIDEVRNEMNELEEQGDLRGSKINNINRSLDALEEDVEGTKGEIKETTSEMERRLSAIEEMLDLDEMDIAQAIKPDACELEQLSTVPESSRDDEFTVRVQRAIGLYENFHEISTPVKSGGERILSRDIKTFLNGYSNTEIKYTQVQRVIDSFVEKTTDDYKVQKTGDGRAILWNPDN